jgi:hypothetical protein
MVDVYDTYLPSGEEYKTIYINMYGAYNSTFSPKGFCFVRQVKSQNKKKNRNILIPVSIVLGAIMIISAIAAFMGGKSNQEPQETQSSQLNNGLTVEDAKKNRDYLYNWLLENGDLTGNGESVVYKESVGNNCTYSLHYNSSSPDKIFASYTSKNSGGYVIIVTVELFASGQEESNAKVVVYNKDNNMRCLEYYHNPQNFSANTPIELVSVSGHDFPDRNISSKDYDTVAEAYAAWVKPMREVEDIGKNSIHAGICSIIDWIDESLCSKAEMDLSDFGYLMYD